MVVCAIPGPTPITDHKCQNVRMSDLIPLLNSYPSCRYASAPPQEILHDFVAPPELKIGKLFASVYDSYTPHGLV